MEIICSAVDTKKNELTSRRTTLALLFGRFVAPDDSWYLFVYKGNIRNVLFASFLLSNTKLYLKYINLLIAGYIYI